MKISILKPIGWCTGVEIAINKLNTIVKTNPKKKIFLIGPLIHNDEYLNSLNNNVVTLNDKNKSRLALLKSIKDPNAIVVLSAHGSPINAIEYGKQYFKNFYDLSCSKVTANLNLFKRLLDQDFKLIYYGNKQHPETKAVISISKQIIVISSIKDAQLLKLNKKQKYVFVNQTTIPQNETKDAYKIINKNNDIKVQYMNTSCQSTAIRFKNIINLPNDIDFLLIVGNKKSNNANKLLEVAKQKNIKSILISSPNELKKIMFKHVSHLAITSSTSTSLLQVQHVLNKIKGWEKIYNF